MRAAVLVAATVVLGGCAAKDPVAPGSGPPSQMSFDGPPPFRYGGNGGQTDPPMGYGGTMGLGGGQGGGAGSADPVDAEAPPEEEDAGPPSDGPRPDAPLKRDTRADLPVVMADALALASDGPVVRPGITTI